MKRNGQIRKEGSRNTRNFSSEVFACFAYFAIFPFCFVVSLAQSNDKPQEKKPKYEKITAHVVLITVSGLRADDFNHADANHLRIPNLQALRAKGGAAVSVESVYPSLTIPAHATIATGTLPADHGVTADFSFNEQTPTATGEEVTRLAGGAKNDAIWDAAKRGGLTTAAIGFPLTAGATINFNVSLKSPPTIMPEGPEGGLPIDQLIDRQNTAPAQLADQLLSRLAGDDFTANKKLREIAVEQRIDHFKALAAAHLIESERPNLLMVNFHSLAAAQERYGVLAPETISALETVDGFLKRIFDAVERTPLAGKTTFLVVSDHGAMKAEQVFNPNVVLERKGWLEIDSQGRITSWRAAAQAFGGSAAIFVKAPADEKLVKDVEKLFQEYFEKPDSPIWRIISRREAAQLGADPRVAFYLDAAPGFLMSARTKGSRTTNSSVRAAHGQLPSRSEMRAALIIAGQGVKPGSKIEYARLIDLAPTIARLFGLEMRTARGRVLAEVLTN